MPAANAAELDRNGIVTAASRYRKQQSGRTLPSVRHTRASPAHPRLGFGDEEVDDLDEPGHDGMSAAILASI
jgi:hypothetical protein